jgi:ABC-type uncharacterized transport system permease subunit
MSTTPIVPSPAPTGSKLQNILGIINIALQGLTIAGSFTPIGAAITAGVKLEQVFQGILTNALQMYQQETGQPIDLLKIPLEDAVA